MLVGEAIKSVMYLKDTNMRAIAKDAGTSYQAAYYACDDKQGKKGMHTSTAVKLLDALDYQLVAIPKGEPLRDEWLKIDDTSEGVKKINRKCVICGRMIHRDEYSQVTPQGRVCQECINDKFKAEQNTQVA